MTPELPIDGNRGYDVCNPDRLPAERIAFVDAIHQQFLQSLSQALTAYLDTPVKGTPDGVDQLPVKEFLENAAGDACVVSLELASTKGRAWVGLSGKLVFHILHNLLGAPPASAPAARTAVTEIERHVLREFFATLSRVLAESWAPAGIALRMDSIQTIDEVRQEADLDGTALVLNGILRMQEQDDPFHVAIPVLAVRLAALENEQRAAAQVAGETAARMARLEALGGASLEVEAYLAGSAIRLGDLAAMQPGQILVLTQPAGSQLECSVNGKARFRGEWIALGDRHGLQVEEIMQPEPAAKN